MDQRIRGYLELLETTPTDAPPLGELERDLIEAGAWEDLVRVYEAHLRHRPTDAELIARTARILEEKLADPVAAERWLRRLLEAEPNHAESVERLVRLYRRRNDEQALCDLLERQASRAPTPEEAAEAYCMLGENLRAMGALGRAATMLQRALRLVPNQRRALAALREVYIGLGRFEAAQTIIAREVAASPHDAQGHAARYADLGRRALEQPYRHAFARSCAEAALALDPACMAAKVLLDAIGALRSGWREQVKLLRTRAMEERDRRTAARLYLQVAALHAAFDDGPEVDRKVDEALRPAFLLWPAMPDALEFLERRHAEKDDLEGLASIWERLVESTAEREAQVELLLRLANLYEVRFDDPERAARARARAAALDPASAEAVLPLIDQYREEGRDEELAALLERHLAASASAATRSELRLLLGETLSRLGEIERALQHVEEAVSLDPRSDRAASLLKTLAMGETRAVARRLELRAERQKDEAARVELLRRAAALDPDGAAERLGRALLLDPTRQDLVEALVEASAGDPDGLVRHLRAAARAAGGEVRRRLLVRVAAILEATPDREGEAAAAWRTVLSLAPGDEEALAALERLRRASADAQTRIRQLEERLAAASDREERRRLQRELAERLEGSDPGAAAVHLRASLEEIEPSIEDLRHLARLFGRAERWREQLEAFDAAIAAGDDSPETGLARATLLVGRLGRGEEGARALLDLLARQPEAAIDGPVVFALEKLAQAGIAVGPIAEALEPRFEAAGAHHRLVGLLEARAAAAGDSAERLEALRAVARIRETRLADLQGAFAALGRALVEWPGEEGLLPELERIAEAAGAHRDLAQLYREAWEGAPPEAAARLAERALSLGERRGDEELIEAARRKLLALDPENDELLAALADRAAAAGRWAEAWSLLDRRLALADADRRWSLELLRAEWLSRQEAWGHAVEAYRAALAAGAPEERVLPALAAALGAAGRQEELVEVIRRQMELAREAGDAKEEARLGMRQAELLASMERKAEAVARYGELLANDPHDAEALAAVEALLEDPDTAAEAARILAGPYEAKQAWLSLRRVLSIRIDAASDPQERLQLLRRLSQLAIRELRDPGLAWESLARAFREVPTDALLRSELRVAAGQAGRIRELAALMAEVAERLAAAEQPAQAIAIERELAELLEKRLGDAAAAAARYERIRALEPRNVEALRALHRLQRELRAFPALHGTCLALAEAIYDPAERIALWQEAARIAAEELEDPAAAAQALQKVHEARPGDASVLAALESLYARMENWEACARVLALQTGPDAACRHAEVLRRHLGDPQAALAILGEVLARDPRHEGARAALLSWIDAGEPLAASAAARLDAAFAAAGEHEKRIDLHLSRLARAGAEEERLQIHEAIVSLHERELGNPELAFVAACRAFAEFPSFAGTLERLAAATGSFDELVAVYEDAAERRPELRRRIAAIQERQLGALDDAIASWQAILAEDPRDGEALEALGRLYAATERPRDLVRILSMRAALADGEEAVALLMQAADTCALALEAHEEAVAFCREALQLAPDHLPALETLALNLREEDELDELIEVLGRLARLQEPGTIRQNTLLRRAELLARGGRAEEAYACCTAVLEEAPTDPRAVALLESLLAGGLSAAAPLLESIYRSTGDAERLLAILERKLHEVSERERAALLEEMVGLRLATADAAAAWPLALARFAAAPEDPDALTSLVELTRQTGEWEALADALENAVARRPGDRRLLAQLAAVQEQALHDPVAARATWERIVALDDRDVEALRSVRRLAIGSAWERLHDVDRRLAELLPAEAIVLLREAAQVAEQHLGDPVRALEAHREILRLAPEDDASFLAVERLLRATGNHRELAEHLAARIETPAVALRLAALRRQALGDPAGALALYARHAAAAREELEAWVRSGGDGASEALAILDPAIEGEHALRIELRERLLAEDGSRAARLLPEIRALHEAAGQAELAFVAACRHFAVDPAAAASDLERLGRATGSLDEVAELYQGAAERSAGAERRDWLVRAATLHEVERGDRAAAIAAWRAILAAAPEDVEALDALIRLLREAGEARALVDALARRAGVEPDDNRAYRFLLEAAEVARSEPDRTLALLRAAHRRFPAGEEAVAALLERIEEPEERISLLGARIEQATGAARTAALRERALLQLRAGRLLAALEDAEALFASGERDETVLGLLRTLVDEPSTRERAAALLEPFAREANDLASLRLLARTRRELGEEEAALALCEAALAIRPADEEICALLAGWAREAGPAGARAFALADEALRRGALPSARIDLREGRLPVAAPVERRSLLDEIRRLHEEQGQPELAFVAACRAFAEGEPSEELLADLERLAAATDSWEELAELYDEARGDGELLRRAARIRERELGDAAAAIERWRRILAERPDDAEAASTLARLLAEAERWEELVELHRSRAAAGVGDVRSAWAEAARLAVERLGDRALAAACWREVLARDPGDAHALRSLADLLDPVEARAELLAILERLLAMEPEDGAAIAARRAELLEATDERAAAEAWSELLGSHPAARGALERLLEGEASARIAAAALVPHLREGGDDAALARALDIHLRHVEGEERLALLGELSAIRERLGQPALAFAAAANLFAARPDDAAVRQRLIDLAEASFGWEELAAVFEDAIDRLPEGDPAAIELRRILAPLYLSRLGRPEAAASCWEKLAAALPDDEEPLVQLDALYRGASAHRELCGVLRRRADRAPAERRRGLLFELATLLEDALGDRPGALGAWREILALDEADEEAVAHLSRLLGETGAWDELAAFLDKRIERAVALGLRDEARELRYRLGRVLQRQGGDHRRAAELFGQVLAEQPRHPATLAALEELSAAPEASSRALAARLLAPIYAEERDWTRHVAMLDAMAEVAEPRERARLHRAAAAVYGSELGAGEMAFLAAGRALRADPDDPENLALCLRTAREAGGLVEELAALLADAAESAATEAGRMELLRARARLLDEAGEAEAARACWERVRAAAPTDGEALAALARLHGALGDVEAQLESLRTLLAREESDEGQRALLYEIAVIQEERKRDPAAALATLRRLLEIAPLDREALARSDRICVEQERWIDLAEILAAEAEAADAAGDAVAQVEFLSRLAALREERLLDREGALVLHARILRIDPAHGPTRARLEKLLAEEQVPLPVLDLLEEAYRATGDWMQLAGILDTRADLVPDPEARRQILVELAKVRAERLGRHDLAFLSLARVFRELPGDREVWPLLWEEARAGDALEEWLALQEEAAARLHGDDLRALALLVAPRCEDPIGDPEAATSWYERARPATEALVALERLHRTAGRWPELADVLDALAERQSDPKERIDLLFRLGRLAEERLGDPTRAAAAYERLLTVDPLHLPALRALEPLREAAGDAKGLYEVLAAQRSATPEGAAWLRLTLRLAEVAEKGLGELSTAAGHCREALARDPRNEAASRGLEALLERQGDWKGLAEHLERRLAGAVDPREIVSLRERLGAVLAEHLEDAEAAIANYEAVLDRDPRNRAALEALRVLHARRGDGEALAAVLRRLVPLQDDAAGVKAIRLELAETLASLGRREEAIENGKRVLDLEPHDLIQLQRAELLFRDLDAWPEVVRAMELQAPLLAGDPDAVVEHWHGVARIWEEQLHRPEGAAAALEKVLEIRLDPAAFDRLRSIYRDVADWRRYALATERFAMGSELPRKVELLCELAEVQEQRLGQRDLAFARLGAAFELDPGNEEIRQRLHRMAGQGGLFEELALIYESVIDLLDEDDPVSVSLLLELGRMQDRELDDPDEAEASFRRILERSPGEPRALEALVDLFARRGADRSLVVVLEQQLEGAVEIEARRRLLHRIAEIHERKLGDTEEAIGALVRALELNPADRETREALAALYRRTGALRELADLLGRSRDLASEEGERLELQLRLARLLENEIGDDEEAIAAWSLAHELAPAAEEPLDALERLYTRRDRWADLLRIYDRKIDVVGSDEERCRLLLKAASIWEGQLGNLQHAIACLDAALSILPTHRVALRELERLLRAAGEWHRLVEVIERHLELADAEGDAIGERVELLVRLGELRYRELQQVDAAEAAYRAAVELDPTSQAALAALGDLYERSGNWIDALEMLDRRARLLGASPESLEIHLRIGRIHHDMLQDRASAIAAWKRATAIDPGWVPALSALREAYREEGNAEAFLEALTAEAVHTTDPAEKTRLWNEVGAFQFERGDEEAAIRAWEEARRHTPDDLTAAEALAERYFDREDWARAEGALEVVCARRSPHGGPDALRAYALRLYRLGLVTEKLGKEARATQAYGRAFELDPTLLGAGEGYARLLVRAGDDAQALRVYQAILVHLREELTDPEVVELHYSIGEIRRRLGDLDAALKSFRAALDLDAWHVDSHRAVVAIAEETGNLPLAIEHRQQLASILEGDEKRALLLDTARMATTRLSDPWQAIDAYAAALRIDPDDVETAETLVDLYRQTRQDAKAMELLERLCAHPEVQADPERLARCRLRLGEHYAAEASADPAALDTALEHYNAVLDLDWRRTEAFQAIESLLVQRQQWRLLEANYVRMLQRMPREEGTRKARVLLYRTLGELYRDVLQDAAAAAEAFKAVTLLAPDDGEAAAAWARLVSETAGSEIEAIDAWRKALPAIADPVDAARALERLHARRRSFDASYVAASVIAELFGKGGSDEKGVIEKLRPFAKFFPTGSITERQFLELVAHEGVRGPVGQIFAILHTHAGALFAADDSAVPVQGREVKIDRRRDRVDLGSGLYLVNAYNRIAAALGMQPPELCKLAGVAGITLANTWPPCVVAGEEMFAEQGSRRQLAFILGRNLAFTRPELAMARFHRERTLEVILQAAVLLGEPRFKRTADAAQVEAVRKRLSRVLPPAAIQKLQQIAYGYARDRRRQKVAAWLEAAELTANRAGALVAGDLAVARHQIVAEAAAAAEIPLEKRLRDLAVFALSEGYGELRKALGLAVQIPG